MNAIMMSFHNAFAMLWETFWALVLGFACSAALQVFVSKDQMTRAFGRSGFREVALATGLGAASSSCSYAAAAAGRVPGDADRGEQWADRHQPGHRLLLQRLRADHSGLG